jgi:hypothetical protein
MPKLFGRFLHQVLYPSEIRTAVDLMAYTFYRDNPFEIITILFGYGANGKSVFTGLSIATGPLWSAIIIFTIFFYSQQVRKNH